MPAEAYVLINVARGEMPRIVRELGNISEVQTVRIVTGPYDIIAVVKATDVDAIGRLLVENIHTIQGIERTLSCIAVNV